MKLFNIIAVTAVTAYAAATAARAETSTECTPNALCYCVQNELKSVIANRVDEIRARIAAQRQQGKAIGYLSIPNLDRARQLFARQRQDSGANERARRGAFRSPVPVAPEHRREGVFPAGGCNRR